LALRGEFGTILAWTAGIGQFERRSERQNPPQFATGLYVFWLRGLENTDTDIR
jgi:hypothetical protein